MINCINYTKGHSGLEIVSFDRKERKVFVYVPVNGCRMLEEQRVVFDSNNFNLSSAF